jgi:regulator of sigma E protease
VKAWHEVRALVEATPAVEKVRVTVQRGETTLTVAVQPGPAPADLSDDLFSSADTATGYTGLVNKDVVIAKVDDNTPAASAGLAPGDRLVRLRSEASDGRAVVRPIGVWETDLAAFQGADARNRFAITYQRGHEVKTGQIQLQEKKEADEFKNQRTRWVFGAENSQDALDSYTYQRHVGVGEALVEGTKQVGQDVHLIVAGLVRLFVGKIPIDSVGGPIMLFVIAEKSAKRGAEFFLRMMAVISVNLGLLNLLPIPVLDGGHLIFFGFEAIRRQPPSLRAREIANAIGLAFIFLLMVLVFRNDIVKYVLG